MTSVVYFNSEGEPEGVSSFVYSEDAEASGGITIEGKEVPDQEILNTWYMKGGVIKTRLPQPSVHHKWDRTKEVWVEQLNELRVEMLSETDRLAEIARSSFVTAGSGQAMTYEAKYQEALQYPEGTSFPWLEGEAEALDMTLQEVAESILEARAKWEVEGAWIEAFRLRAKKQVREAQTASEMHAIVKLLPTV